MKKGCVYVLILLSIITLVLAINPDEERTATGKETPIESPSQIQQPLSDPNLALQNALVTQPLTTSSTSESSPVQQISIPSQATISNSPKSFSASKINQATANNIRLGQSSDITFNRDDSSVSAKKNTYLRLESEDLPFHAFGNKNMELSKDQSFKADSTSTFQIPGSFQASDICDLHSDSLPRTLVKSFYKKR